MTDWQKVLSWATERIDEELEMSGLYLLDRESTITGASDELLEIDLRNGSTRTIGSKTLLLYLLNSTYETPNRNTVLTQLGAASTPTGSVVHVEVGIDNTKNGTSYKKLFSSQVRPYEIVPAVIRPIKSRFECVRDRNITKFYDSREIFRVGPDGVVYPPKA